MSDAFPIIDGKIVLDAGRSERGWHHSANILTCPQLYAYVEVIGLKLPRSAPLVRGALVHLGLAHYYGRLRLEQDGQDPDILHTVEDALTLGARRLDDEDCATNSAWAHDHLDEARIALEAYAKRFAPERQQVRILQVEAQNKAFIQHGLMSGPADGPHVYTQRFDLVVGWTDGRVAIWDHKCLPASTMVETQEGPATVGTLLRKGQEWSACAWGTAAQGLRWARATAPVPAGVQDVYEVRTRDGKRERYGYRHPLLTQRGWVQADALIVGDRVASVVQYPDRPDAPVNDHLLRLLGLLTGDGTWHRDAVTFAKGDDRVHEVFRQALEAEGHTWAKQACPTKVEVTRVHRSAALQEKLRALGVRLVRSPERALPGLPLSRRQVGILLGALWLADGSARVVRNGQPRICYSCRSEPLVRDIQRLLNHLGLIASVTHSSALYKGERRSTHTVSVIGVESKRRFLRMVDSGLIDCAWLLSTGEMHRALDASVGQGDQRNPTMDGELYWSRVVEVAHVGREECYDITVPGPSTFVAGGLVTHNTTGRFDKRQDRAYARSGQFQGFWLFGRGAYGDRFAGVWINYVRVGKSPDFKRVPAHFKPHRAACHADTIRWAEHQIAWLKQSGVDPWHWPKVGLDNGACEHRFGACPAADLCDFGPSAYVED